MAIDPDYLLSQSQHRPSPIPASPWIMTMRWINLAFLHWPIQPNELRPLLPQALELDTFDGAAWIGVVPFQMEEVGPRRLAQFMPGSAFPELNVRTYVRSKHEAGVWFFSLDAANRLAVRGARWLFHLPYFDARFSIDATPERTTYHCVRAHRHAPAAEFDADYWVEDRPDTASPELRRWLTERYCLYTANRRNEVFRMDVHHLPWSLEPGGCVIRRNTMAHAAGMKPFESPPLVHLAAPLDVLAWNKARVP